MAPGAPESTIASGVSSGVLTDCAIAAGPLLSETVTENVWGALALTPPLSTPPLSAKVTVTAALPTFPGAGL
jgi:hypothetical protein